MNPFLEVSQLADSLVALNYCTNTKLPRSGAIVKGKVLLL